MITLTPIDFMLPGLAFVLLWACIGVLGGMAGYRRSGAFGFALGAMVAGVWIVYLAIQVRHPAS